MRILKGIQRNAESLSLFLASLLIASHVLQNHLFIFFSSFVSIRIEPEQQTLKGSLIYYGFLTHGWTQNKSNPLRGSANVLTK